MTGKSAKTIIIVLFSLLLLSGCTGELQPQATIETPAPTATSTRQPTHTPTLASTATPTATVEPADGTPEKYLQILNEIYEYYEKTMPSAATSPSSADHFLSPDGRYLALQNYLFDGDFSTYSIYDILDKHQVDIPLDLQEKDGIYDIRMDSWSWDGSTLFMRISPTRGLYPDTSLLIVQSIDETNYVDYIIPYPEDSYGDSFILSQDGSQLILINGWSNSTSFYVIDIETNQVTKFTLPEEINFLDAYYFNETDYIVSYYYSLIGEDWENSEPITELQVVNGATGKSEVVYSGPGYQDIVDYDPERKLVLIKTDEDQFIFLNTETWAETTFHEEDALFGQETKLIGHCIPYNFYVADKGRQSGLYNLITGETQIIGDPFYLGWYPFFENHLIAVHDEDYTSWIEFLDVVCE